MIYWQMLLGVMIGVWAAMADVSASAMPGYLTSVTNTVSGDPAVAIGREGAQVKITFAGSLEAAATVGGPWHEVTNAASPHVPEPAAGRRFYRTRSPVSIFSSRSVVEFSLSGPLQAHF